VVSSLCAQAMKEVTGSACASNLRPMWISSQCDLGSIALAAALAFGLGGREVAGRMLEGAYDKGQREAGQVKQDLRQGRAEAERMKDDVAQRTETSESSGLPESQPRTVIR
jgi:hypothetical protein